MSAVHGPSPGAQIVKVGWVQKRGTVLICDLRGAIFRENL